MATRLLPTTRLDDTHNPVEDRLLWSGRRQELGADAGVGAVGAHQQVGARAGAVGELGGDRRRRSRPGDAERTKTSILDAALVEFGEHGFAGARTVAIARRAGVNPQLISYYFDGKAGLYQALAHRWESYASELSGLDVPLDQVVGNFVRASVENRAQARLLVWEGLSGPAGRCEYSGAGAFFSTMVEGIRRRQERGEVAAELDPAMVLILLFSAALTPVLMPHVTEHISGAPADSPEFLQRYVDQLGQIVRHLAR